MTPCTAVCALQFVELHGDRGGLDDPAMVCGIGSMEGVSFMFIGHQKGRNTKVGAWCWRGGEVKLPVVHRCRLAGRLHVVPAAAPVCRRGRCLRLLAKLLTELEPD